MFINTKYIISRQRGVVLIIALLILSLIMVSVLALSKVIINELKMSLNTNNSIAAFYAAETGAEKALQHLKYSRQNLDDFNFFTDLASYSGSEETINSQASFDIITASTTAMGFVARYIATSSPAHINIIDPAGNITGPINWGEDPTGLNYKYKISWTVDNCFPSHASDRLEITVSSFADKFTDVGIDKKVIVCNCAYGSDQCDTSTTQYTITDNKYYSFSFKPLDSEVEELHFNLYEDNVEVGVLSEVFIKTEGSYGNSEYNLEVKVPSLAPVSDIFSYVLFSEQELKKDF